MSIVLPHDGIISTLFFRCWSREVGGCRTRINNRKNSGAVDAECTRLLARLNEFVNRVSVRLYEFRFIATFGDKVANDVDISKKVCFDFDFDDVAAHDSTIESRVPACVVADISRGNPTFDQYIEDVVRVPVILTAEEYVLAIRESFRVFQCYRGVAY